MEFQTIKDQKGKEHIVFNAQELMDDNLIGDKKEDFEFLQLLGSGSFGKVFKVSSLINHKIYAMKILNLASEDNGSLTKGEKEKYFISEIELLKKLNHPNIVKYYKSFREEDQLYIIMEYFDNGDLNDYINVLKSENKNKKEEIWNIFYQSISGLNYLHSKGVAHRDIKPANIFMTKNKIIKIGDFGVSALITGKKSAEKIRTLKQTIVGTPIYMSPELKNKRAYNEKVDIFAMGCVFYKICCLKDYQKEEYAMEGDRFVLKIVSTEIPSNYDEDLMGIIRLMLEEDPEKRANSRTILEKIKENYNKVFIQNSGFYSVLRCMINLQYLRHYFLHDFKKILKTTVSAIFDSKFFSQKFLSLIEDGKNWIDNVIYYRHKIIEENNFLNNNNEINP